MRFAVSIAIAVGFIVIALLLAYAERAGWVGGDVPDRAILVLLGLTAAAYANLAPKQIGRSQASPKAEGRAQAARRAAGWSLTLGGLAYAAIAAFAPLSIAPLAAVAIMAAALIFAVGYGFWTCRKA